MKKLIKSMKEMANSAKNDQISKEKCSIYRKTQKMIKSLRKNAQFIEKLKK